jgi:hypothetical protein
VFNALLVSRDLTLYFVYIGRNRRDMGLKDSKSDPKKAIK